MTFAQFMSILRARWKVALAVLLATVGLTLLISLLMPKQYKAIASVVIDFKPDPISAMLNGGIPTPGFMATQVDIIQSDRVAQRVVRNLKLADNPQIRKQWQDEANGEGSIESWLGTVFQKNMDVVPSRESSVIQVSYKAGDPRFAAALANAFVKAYIDTSLELRVDPARRYSNFFEAQSKEAREALEAAQTKLSSFQKDNGIIASDERLDIENARLNELSTQLTALQALAAESSSRQAQAQGAQGDRMQEVLNNSLILGIKADINRGEARLQEMSTRYGDSHPSVLEAKANLAELRSRLDSETKKVVSGVGLNNNVNRQREADIRASLEAQRAKVLKLKAVRDEGLVIMRDVENAQRAYDAVRQRYIQTNLESQTTQSNVNMLTEAVPPITPSSPRLVLNTLLALLGGILLAIGTALFLELRDRRVRNLDDVVAALDLPVIGNLDKPGSKSGKRGGHSIMRQRLLAPLPESGRGA
ncbi:MAG: chain length determinant protein EpsF [Burkholderiales bacterium]|nr:chain length determinant protein EpsF [Burkholderiales bacterium]